jgi:hypothetical protein
MRIEQNPDGSVDVWLRQSWLSNARDCLEKARHLIHNESISSDAAVIGTSVHAGAEAGCLDGTLADTHIIAAAVNEWNTLITSEPIKWVKYDEQSGRAEVARLAQSWHNNLRRHVEAPRFVEHNFEVVFDTFEYRDQKVTVHLKGTIDLVQFNDMWDWKTSAKKYSWRDKQNDSIQASLYAAVAVQEGWLEYPVAFNFGVLLRGTNDSQVVTVRREESHTEWLKTQIRSTVRLALSVGTDVAWPTNDTGGLCSPVWCDNWGTCKGSLLAPVPYPTRSKS